MKHKTWFIAVIFALLLACGEQHDPKLEQSYLQVIVDKAAMPFAHLEVPDHRNVELIQDAEDACLKFLLFPDQARLHGGIRSELSVDYPFVEGDSITYSWDFKIDTHFDSDFPQNRWWLIGQWHDQPDRNQGETWENFGSHSPTIAIGIGEQAGDLGLVLIYGQTIDEKKQALSHPIIIKRDKWYRIKVCITWSQGTAGQVLCSVNDQLRVELSGPNMNNAFQHYMKLGMYRHPEIKSQSAIYLKNVRIDASQGFERTP